MKVEWAPGDGLIQLTTESLVEAETLLALAYHKHTAAGAVSGCPVCHEADSATPEEDLVELLRSIYDGLMNLILPKEEETNGPRTDA